MARLDVIVFTSKDKFHSEIGAIIQMFEAGLKTLHVRQPKFSTKELQEYIEAYPEEYRKRMVIHSHHELAKLYSLKGIHLSRSHRKRGAKTKINYFLGRYLNPSMKYTKSCHSLSNVDGKSKFYDYVFLSPVFDSISKKDYTSKFGSKAIKTTLDSTNQKVYALGGVSVDNLDKVMVLGFHGVGILGSVWEGDQKPQDVYKAIKAKIIELEDQEVFAGSLATG